jgi:hypothetical protein
VGKGRVPWILQGTSDSGSSHRNTGIAPATLFFTPLIYI